MTDIVLLTSRSPAGELTNHGRLLREAESAATKQRFVRTLPSSVVGGFLRAISNPAPAMFVDADAAREGLQLLEEALVAARLPDVLCISANGVFYDEALVRTSGEGWVDGRPMQGWQNVEVGIPRMTVEHLLQQPEDGWRDDSITVRGQPRAWAKWGAGFKKRTLREQDLRLAMVPINRHPHWRRLLEVVESHTDATFCWTPA